MYRDSRKWLIFYTQATISPQNTSALATKTLLAKVVAKHFFFNVRFSKMN